LALEGIWNGSTG